MISISALSVGLGCMSVLHRSVCCIVWAFVLFCCVDQPLRQARVCEHPGREDPAHWCQLARQPGSQAARQQGSQRQAGHAPSAFSASLTRCVVRPSCQELLQIMQTSYAQNQWESMHRGTLSHGHANSNDEPHMSLVQI